jgi:quercetin dioxygenase-like cupin family protein
MTDNGGISVKELNISTLVLFMILSTTSSAQQSVATGLFQTDLADIEGREAVVLEVEYPPGVASSSHRHSAHTFVYVLEGTVEMQVADGELQKLVAGQTFYETPNDIHSVSRNASDTEPAKILVFIIKMKGAPMSELVED